MSIIGIDSGGKILLPLLNRRSDSDLYAANWNAESVYTPAFVLDGREWRGAIVPAGGGEGAGSSEKLQSGKDDSLLVNFEPASGDAQDFDCYSRASASA